MLDFLKRLMAGKGEKPVSTESTGGAGANESPQEFFERVVRETPQNDGYEVLTIASECEGRAKDLMRTDPVGAVFLYRKAEYYYARYASWATSGGEGTARMMDVKRIGGLMKDLASARPLLEGEYGPGMVPYLERVGMGDIVQMLQKQLEKFTTELRGAPTAKRHFRYAEGKWTLQELVQHVADTERVFAYRALSIARGDTTPLPGFDENPWAANSGADRRDWHDLVEEFDSIRRANILMFRGLAPEAWVRRGTANGQPVSVRALAAAMWGHVDHHQGWIKNRYLWE